MHKRLSVRQFRVEVTEPGSGKVSEQVDLGVVLYGHIVRVRGHLPPKYEVQDANGDQVGHTARYESGARLLAKLAGITNWIDVTIEKRYYSKGN